MGQILTVGHQMIEGDYEYYPPFGNINYGSGAGGDIDKAQVPVSIDAALVQFYVTLCTSDGTPSGPGAGESYIITFWGGSNSFSCVIEGTDTNGTARGLSILEPDDEIFYTVQRTGGAGQRHVRISAILWSPDADVSHISGHFAASSTSTLYSGMGYTPGSTSSLQDKIYAPMSGTLSDLYVILENAPGTGNNYTWTLMKNGSPTALTVTIADSDKDGSDSVNSVEFSATDVLALRIVPTSSPVTGDVGYSMKLTTQDNVSFLSGGGQQFGEVCPDEAPVCGRDSEYPSTGAYKLACHAMTLTGLYAKVENAPGAGESIVIKIVKETDSSESDTALTVTFSEGETEKNITGQSVAIAKGDTIHAERVRTGTTSTDEWWVGVAVSTDHTGPTVTTDKILNGTAYGTVSAIGDGSTCSVRGFCYKEATSGDPNIFDDSVALDGSVDDGEFATGEYTVALSLVAGKLYRVRAFAVNDTSLAYSTTKAAYFEYPSDSVARVSSIRRIYRPGLLRMEIGVGELGFDVEVSEAAIKRVPDDVTEPEVPPEDGEAVRGGEPITPEDWAEIIKQQQATEWFKAMTAPAPVWSGKYTAPEQLKFLDIPAKAGTPAAQTTKNFIATFSGGKTQVVGLPVGTTIKEARKIAASWGIGVMSIREA